MIEYVHASPGVIGAAVHGPDRHRIEYVDGVADEAWLKAGMWRAYVYPSEGRSYTLHLGIPEDGDVTLADVVGEVVPDGIVTRGEPGPPGEPGRDGQDGQDGHTPVFTWEGTALAIDGGEPVDLKGEKGDGSSWAELTGKPATYPSTVAEVDGLQAIIDRNTVGTGWRNVAAVTTITPEGVLGTGAVSRIKRVGTTVFMEGRGPSGDALLAAKMSTRPTLANLPAGFTAAGYAPARGFVSHDYGATLGILETFTSPSVVRLNFGTRTTNFTAYLNWSIEFETTDPWPTVLPGTPA